MGIKITGFSLNGIEYDFADSSAHFEMVKAQNADYAEVAEWRDGNPNNEDRIGYFVAVDKSESGITMVKAGVDSDIRGVTMSTPGFAANATPDKFDENGQLLPQYDYVGWAGFVPVRIDSTITAANQRCMSNKDGIATLSSNNLGYQIIEILEDNVWALVLVEPQGDMIQRIKTDMDNQITSEVAEYVNGETPKDTSMTVQVVNNKVTFGTR